MAQSSSSKKIANGLVAAGTAAVLSVYAAGYTRTRSAAQQLDAQTAERRPGAPDSRGPAPVPANAGSQQPVSAENADAASPPLSPEKRTTPSQIASLERTTAPAPMPAAGISTDTTTATTSVSAPVIPAPAPTITPTAPPPVATVASVTPPSAVQAPPLAVQPAAKWKDGTYTGWGTCRHGDIQAEVIVADGRITSAKIAQCLTRYSCDVIGRLPPEVLQRQSPEVDYVSGATQSANAFYYALVDALSKAK